MTRLRTMPGFKMTQHQHDEIKSEAREKLLIFHISWQVQKILQREKITNSFLAKKMGTSRPYITKIITKLRNRDNISVRTLAKLMSALNRSIEIRFIEDEE